MRIALAKVATGTVSAIVALAIGGSMLAHAQTTYTNDTSGSGTTLSPSGNVDNPGTPNTGTNNTTDSGTPNADTTSDPGVPNTGSGASSAANITLLGLAALAALGSVAYLSRQRFEQ